MNKFATIVLSVALLAGAQCASAQSFKGLFKKAAEKATQKVVDKVEKKVEQKVEEGVSKITSKSSDNKTTSQSSSSRSTGASTSSSKSTAKSSAQSTSRTSALERQVDAMVGKGNNKNMEDEAPTVRLPKSHTALFAPLGYPTEPQYGIKSVKPSMPPRAAEDQVAWSDKLPNVYDLDNKSLVDEYVLLDDCFNDGYFATLTPAHWRYNESVKGELYARVGKLDELVEQYNEALDEYNSSEPQWVINGIHDKIAAILESREYKTLIRSSLVPLAKYMKEKTKTYFAAHGGYENAHKAAWTKWDPKPNKQSVSTSASGQSGTIVSENASGAKIDIGGVVYVLHNKNGRASRAFISEVANTAVANKDIVIPDYVTYKGQKYPVRDMRAELFRNTTIKSVKLPATLTEIANAAFRETPITEIVIPASVKIVQGSAFYGCKNLAKVVFEGDAMQELHGCFQKCTALRSIKLPSSVGLMSYDMFEGCTALAEVVLPTNLKEVYQTMFKGCKALKTINIPSSVTKIGAQAFAESGITSLDISHVREFGGFCFLNCKALKTVKLNAALKANFLMDTYDQFMTCPLLQVKYENNQYVYPDGFIFVEAN